MSETGVLEPQAPLKRRKLTLQDAKAIAEMVAERLTETEACAQLEIQPHQWFQWKVRAKRNEYFEKVLSRVKGAHIKACIATLKEAGTRENLKTGQLDWRAHDRLLDRLDPSRFAAPPSQVNVNLLVNGAPNDLVEAARQSFLKHSTPQPVVSCGVQPEHIEHKTLPEVTSDLPATDV